MSNSLFKSFETLQKNMLDLSYTVPELQNYLAHLPSNASLGIQPEQLQDHIELVNRMAMRLIHLHGQEEIVNGLIEEICDQLKIEIEPVGNFVKELFLASIAFHDYGKLNENFQRERMQNERFPKVHLLIGSQHSILSAYLFLNYYLQKLEIMKMSTGSINVLVGIICGFADPILKHHASTFDVGDTDSDKCEELSRFLPLIGMPVPTRHLQKIIENKRIFEEDIFANNEKSESFPLFTLLKLNFSILTAADYLATLSYQSNVVLPETGDANWWGIFSPEMKIKLHEQYKNSTSYNRLALEEPEKLVKEPLDSFNKQSGDNLNCLRSRMLGEVILQLRKHKDKRLFYLKAPTGAGKTNFSLAAAVEMLQHDIRLNKILYVFPFTTLITQTYNSVKETLNLGNNEIVQLHSRSEWNKKDSEKTKDGLYENEWENHIDNLFVHYPIIMLSHIRFFDILKGNQKESNYLLCRLANSVVIIDELQSYNPKFWDHVNYFIVHYAQTFNMRFILMSATLPEIGRLTTNENHDWINLITKPEQYFHNVNFAGRVSFDFTFLEMRLEGKNKLNNLADFVAEKSEEYAKQNENDVKIIIEFITKFSATDFAKVAMDHPVLRQYTLLMMTGTILEPRRVQIKDWLKCKEWLIENPKMLLISTQVVEAGVDIDMDIGFKDTSLIDSDEQLAGRVNRNASKAGNFVYLFNLDNEGIVYNKDERLKLQRNELNFEEHKIILEQKDFNRLYDRIIEKHLENRTQLIRDFDNYLEHLGSLRFTDANREFQLIKDKTVSLFVPLALPLSAFSKNEIKFLVEMSILVPGLDNIFGEKIFELYEKAILNHSGNFINNRNALRQLQSLLSKFTISVYPQTAKRIEEIEKEKYMKSDPIRYGYLYCSGHIDYYSYEIGLQLAKDERIIDFI